MTCVEISRQIGDKIDTQLSWSWKHFFTSKIVLRVIVCCLRGVGSMCSSRRIPRFRLVSLYCFLRGTAGFQSSWRRYGLVSSLRVVASFLSLRVVGSSFLRLRYILDSAKSTSQKQDGNHKVKDVECSYHHPVT